MKKAEIGRQKAAGTTMRIMPGELLVASPAKELVEIRDCLLRIEQFLTTPRERVEIKVNEVDVTPAAMEKIAEALQKRARLRATF